MTPLERALLDSILSRVPPGTVRLSDAILLTAAHFEKRSFANTVSVFESNTGQFGLVPSPGEMIEDETWKRYATLHLRAFRACDLQAMIGESGDKCLSGSFWCCGIAHEAIFTSAHEGEVLTIDREALTTWWETIKSNGAAPVDEPGAAQESEKSRALYRTGSPGRPGSMHLVKDEFRRRVNAGITLPKLTDESNALEAWLSKEHPKAAPCKAKTIANGIRDEFKAQKTCPKITCGS